MLTCLELDWEIQIETQLGCICIAVEVRRHMVEKYRYFISELSKATLDTDRNELDVDYVLCSSLGWREHTWVDKQTHSLRMYFIFFNLFFTNYCFLRSKLCAGKGKKISVQYSK